MTVSQNLFLGCVIVALLLGCDPSATPDQSTNQVDNPADVVKDVDTTPVDDAFDGITDTVVDTPVGHDPSVADPMCQIQCPGFYEKQGTWYFDGNKRPEAAMQATCSIDPNGMCCFQLSGSLGNSIGKKVILENDDGMLPIEADPMLGYELTDNGDKYIMILNVWAYGQIDVTYSYTR